MFISSKSKYVSSFLFFFSFSFARWTNVLYVCLIRLLISVWLRTLSAKLLWTETDASLEIFVDLIAVGVKIPNTWNAIPSALESVHKTTRRNSPECLRMISLKSIAVVIHASRLPPGKPMGLGHYGNIIRIYYYWNKFQNKLTWYKNVKRNSCFFVSSSGFTTQPRRVRVAINVISFSVIYM